MEKVMGPWTFTLCDTRLLMTDRELAETKDIIHAWEPAFAREENASVRIFGKPSILVRVDYACQSDGSIGVYEVEERPCGMGMGMQYHPYFCEHFSRLFRRWYQTCGKITSVVSPHRVNSCDDTAWASELRLDIKYTYDVPEDGIYWVRADPHETDYHSLVSSSLTTICNEGDKTYGPKLGLWKEIPQNPDELPWEVGFAIKPLQGSKMENLYLWKPRARDLGGIVTRTRILKEIERGNVAFYQEWIDPEYPCFLPDGYFMIRRVFFGWDVDSEGWDCLGGFYTARPGQQCRLHGASDATFGIIMP